MDQETTPRRVGRLWKVAAVIAAFTLLTGTATVASVVQDEKPAEADLCFYWLTGRYVPCGVTPQEALNYPNSIALANYLCAYGSFRGAPPDHESCVNYVMVMRTESRAVRNHHFQELYKSIQHNGWALAYFWQYAQIIQVTANTWVAVWGFYGAVALCTVVGETVGWVAGIACEAVIEARRYTN